MKLLNARDRATALMPKVAHVSLAAVTAAVNSLETEIRVLTESGDEQQIRWEDIELTLAEALKPLGWGVRYHARAITGWNSREGQLALRVQGDALHLTTSWKPRSEGRILLSSAEIPLPPGIAQVLKRRAL